MGNNQLYTIYERQVIDAYDSGRLSGDRKAAIKVLRPILEIGRGTDIDHGGSQDLETKDGKSADEVVVEVWGYLLPRKPGPDDPPDYADGYWETLGELFNAVTRRGFGWE